MRTTEKFKERFKERFPEESYDDYLSSQALTKTFVDDLVVIACAEYLNLNLHIIDVAGTIQLNTSDASEEADISYIARTEHPNHYMATEDLV
jgi:hypothetical protein